MLKVIKPGFFTSIQDSGRFGFRALGVPISGAMDAYSSQFANMILGNKKSAAVLEMTMTGPTLEFFKPTVIAISGAHMHPRLNDELVKMNTSLVVNGRSVLSFDRSITGFRAYLAIADGFLGSEVLGSRSMYSPITESNKIKKGDIIDYKALGGTSYQFHAQVKFDQSIFSSKLSVFKGPDYDRLSSEIQAQLNHDVFKVAKSNNRMAYQLEPEIENTVDQILTAPVLPGTVQLTPLGSLIVLMRDCQTTGGYPRVLQLSESAINRLSQKTTGNNIIFRLKD